MSDKLLPIDRVAELDNVGVIEIQYDHGIQYDQFHCFLLFHLSKEEETYIVSPLAMQEIKVTMDEKKRFLKGKSFFETRGIATPHQGGYGAAIHDYVLWAIKNKVSISDRRAVSDEAARVREIYANARKGSVHAFPIDNYAKRLTPKIDDDYMTHFAHGGFDVYPEHKGRHMEDDPTAYMDWAVRLTPEGKKEINAACMHLKQIGKKMVQYLCAKNDIEEDFLKTKMQELSVAMFYTVLSHTSGFTQETGNEIRLEITHLNMEITDNNISFEAPPLDSSKKSKQILGTSQYTKRTKPRK